MDVFQAMTEMRAMRRLKPDPVPPELIREVIEYAIHAPSGSNSQGWKFIVVTDPAVRRQVGEYYRKAVDLYLARINTAPLPHQSHDEWERLTRAVRWQGDHLASIPVLIFPCLQGLEGMDFSQPVTHSSMNGSIWPAIQNLLLACRAKELGAAPTTLHLLFAQQIEAVLGLPPGAHTFAMVPVGYPMGQFGPTRRGDVDDVIAWDRWA